MFSRLSQIIFSYFTTRFEGLISAVIVKVLQDFVHQSRKTLLVIMTSLVLSLLLTASIIITLLEAAAQYDGRGSIYFSALLSSSLALAVLSFAGLAFIFWPHKPKAALIHLETQVQPAAHNPFEEILAAVVAEGVQAFKTRRETRRERPRPHPRDFPEA
jgi:hypothetical protein